MEFTILSKRICGSTQLVHVTLFLLFYFQLVEEKKNLTASLESIQAEADFAKKQLDQAQSMLHYNLP